MVMAITTTMRMAITTTTIIVSTDNNQHVMAVLVGTNAGELLAYWNQQEWLVHP